MTLLENKEHVTHITMRPHAIVKCRIGQDWYNCDFEVLFDPGKYYPDYMEVNAYCLDEIGGKTLNIEEAARMLFDYLEQYDPVGLTVINHIRGCDTHFDVDVVIE